MFVVEIYWINAAIDAGVVVAVFGSVVDFGRKAAIWKNGHKGRQNDRLHGDHCLSCLALFFQNDRVVVVRGDLSKIF